MYGLFEAAWMLANDREAGRRFADLFIRSRGAVTLEELEALSDLQNVTEAELRGKLMSGELTAAGLQQGRNPPGAIHPHWWRRARMDLWASRAQVDETVISDIEISPSGGLKSVDTIERTDKTFAAASAEAECVVWLKQAWPLSQAIRKPDWLEQAQQKWRGLPKTAFDRAWAAAAKEHSGMSGRGRPSKKIGR